MKMQLSGASFFHSNRTNMQTNQIARIRNFVAALLCLLSALPLCAADKPNLLVIMTDEHNFRTLGCYRDTLSPQQAFMWGKAVVETPHIDSLARNGVICTSFYATTPVCSPSRASFISGLYPQATPVVTNNIPLNDNIVSFAELMKRQGYKTGYSGKWHLDGSGKPQWAPKRKFGFDDNRYMFNRGHWKKLEITGKGPRIAARSENGIPNYNVAGADEKSFTTDFLTDRTIEFIEANKDQPFTYMVSIPDPHGPDTVRVPYDTMYKDQSYEAPKSQSKPDEGLPAWGQKQSGKFQQSSYYGMVRCIDDNVGRIIEKLKKEKLLGKTAIVFTSDHGDLRGEHFRQNKGVPYESSSRVPFIVQFPGKIEKGTVVNEALTSVDFLPTMMNLMNIETSGKEHGRDASNLLATGKAPTDWNDIAFVRGTGTTSGWMMAVSDRYKLIFSSHDPAWFFDLQRDPDEMGNLFTNAAYRETIQNMATAMKAYGEKHNDPFLKLENIAADVKWSIEGTGEYKPAASPRKKKSKKK